MSTNLIPIKSFLGKYYSEILYCTMQDKYKDTGLEKFLEQRFIIQGNKTQMIVDPGMSGLVMIVSGNEIHISKELYDHPSVIIANSLENQDTLRTNPRSLYDTETFQTLAYLICQNITTLTIIGEIEEPIYVRYKADYETFYSSVITFELNEESEVEIVEEIESMSALNAVTNYILNPFSKLKLSTFYQNNIAGLSFVYRNIFARERSELSHVNFGKGSSNVIDETKIRQASASKSEFLGIVDSCGRDFHTILYVEPAAQDYKISVDYRNIFYGKHNVTFFPMILGQKPVNDSASIDVSHISSDEIPEDLKEAEVKNYISPIVDRAILERMVGAKRFYDNKTKFLHFL